MHVEIDIGIILLLIGISQLCLTISPSLRVTESNEVATLNINMSYLY